MATHLELILDLELSATPIAGQIFTASDPARPFHGWLELASALEALRNDALTANAPRPLRSPHTGTSVDETRASTAPTPGMLKRRQAWSSGRNPGDRQSQ
jgi:hypothetical protein